MAEIWQHNRGVYTFFVWEKQMTFERVNRVHIGYQKFRAAQWSVFDFPFGQLLTFNIVRNESNWLHKNLCYRLIYAL